MTDKEQLERIKRIDIYYFIAGTLSSFLLGLVIGILVGSL